MIKKLAQTLRRKLYKGGWVSRKMSDVFEIKALLTSLHSQLCFCHPSQTTAELAGDVFGHGDTYSKDLNCMVINFRFGGSLLKCALVCANALF